MTLKEIEDALRHPNIEKIELHILADALKAERERIEALIPSKAEREFLEAAMATAQDWEDVLDNGHEYRMATAYRALLHERGK